MASFDLFKSKILHIEGGYQKNTNDRGNYTSSGKLIGTNMGISAKALEEYLGREPALHEMANLSRSTATKIYREQYWNRHKLYEFESQELAELVADGIINHGPGTSTKPGGVTLLQNTLNVFGEELKVDGKIGPLTIAAVNRQTELNGAALYNIYREERMEHYRNIALNDPTQQIFLGGWMDRLERYYPEKEDGATITAKKNALGKAIDVAFAGNRKVWLIILLATIIPALAFFVLRATILKPKAT